MKEYITETCKNLKIEDVSPWRDVFDHPTYKYTCLLTGKTLCSTFSCKKEKCKNFAAVTKE